MRRSALPVAALLLIAALSVPAAGKAPAAPCSSAGPAGIGTTCTGVGPGTFISVDSGGGCTLGFVLRGSDGATYVETAGHCAVPIGSGARVWRPGLGPAVRLSSPYGEVSGSSGSQLVGRVVYAVREPNDVDEVDFAVIRFEKGIKPYTSVPHYGGPTGLNVATTTQPQLLNLFGRPPALGDTIPARPLLAHGLAHPEHAFATGIAAPGDSGGPVLDEQGRAVGVLLGAGGNRVTAGTTGAGDSHGGGTVRILRLGPALARAERALGIRLTLALGT